MCVPAALPHASIVDKDLDGGTEIFTCLFPFLVSVYLPNRHLVTPDSSQLYICSGPSLYCSIVEFNTSKNLEINSSDRNLC